MNKEIDTDQHDDENGLSSGQAEHASIDSQDVQHNKGKLDEGMNFIVSELRHQMDSLQNFIKDKEQKKLLIFRYSIATLPIVGAVFVAAFANMHDIVSNNNSLIPIVMINTSALVFTIFVWTMCSSIIKYLISIKRETILAVRQLNCFRQGYLASMELLLDTPDLSEKAGLPNNHSLFDCLVRNHNKYPTDNTGLRKAYTERTDSRIIKTFEHMLNRFPYAKKHWLRHAVKNGQYRKIFFLSGDLFSILALACLAVGISFSPLIVNVFLTLAVANIQSMGWLLITGFSLVNILIIILFTNYMLKALFITVNTIDATLTSDLQDSTDNSSSINKETIQH